jgi:hypothetical protein
MGSWLACSRAFRAFSRTGPLRKHGLTITEQHEQIRRAVVIDVNDRPSLCVRLGVELLNEIGLAVEVPIGLATDESAPLVVLLDVRETVEIAVYGDFSQQPSIVVVAPDVRAAVAVSVLRSYVTSGGPDLDGCDSRRGNDAQQSDAPNGQAPHR